jgi:hypothetical protein
MDSDTLVHQVIAISFLVGSIVRLDCSLVPKHNLLFIFIFLRSENMLVIQLVICICCTLLFMNVVI